MYNRDRKGYASAQQVSDDSARSQNLTLMQQKRKRQLEEQLEMKLDTQRQYANPRGIGQRGGQAVPQRDMDILQDQIDTIRRQLAEMTGQAPSGYSSQAQSMPATPHGHGQPMTPASSNHSSVAPYQQQQQQQQYHQQQPQSGGRPPMQSAMPGSLNTPAQNGHQFQPAQGGGPAQPRRGPEGTPLQQVAGRPAQPGSAGKAPSKRDQVWNAKYQRWLTREREASRQGSRGGPSVPPLSGGAMPGGFTPVSAPPPQSYQQQQQPQPSGPVAGRRASQDMAGFAPPGGAGPQTPSDCGAVRYGRRATPPSEAQRPPVAPMQAGNFGQPPQQQWQQQQQQQQRGQHHHQQQPPQFGGQQPGYGGSGRSSATSQQQGGAPWQQQQHQQQQQQVPQGRRANQSTGLW